MSGATKLSQSSYEFYNYFKKNEEHVSYLYQLIIKQKNNCCYFCIYSFVILGLIFTTINYTYASNIKDIITKNGNQSIDEHQVENINHRSKRYLIFNNGGLCKVITRFIIPTPIPYTRLYPHLLRDGFFSCELYRYKI